MAGKALNKNNSAVKRIMQEARELANDPSTDYHAAPLEDDIFEWHCTLRGSEGTEFEGGLYHFRILLPAEYPFRPPSIMMLTPSGRFELNTKICISFTNYHEELWQPAWGVRTALVGLQGFFPLKGQLAAGVGSVESHPNERKRLAALSRDWTCPTCKIPNKEILPDPVPPSQASSSRTDSSPPSESAQPTSQPPVSEPEKDSEPCSNTDALPQSPGRPDPEKRDNEDDRTPVSPAPTTQATENRAGRNETTRMAGRGSQKPPLLLDSAIVFLLLVVFVICSAFANLDFDPNDYANAILAGEPYPQSTSSTMATMSSPPPIPSSSSAIKANRRNSLRLADPPPSVPIPPSLLQSPWLNKQTKLLPSKDAATSPRLPTEEDDCWLQDQIPVPSRGRPSPPSKTHSDIQHQSPPLTPPVRSSSVFVGPGSAGSSHIGDWRLQQPPSGLDYPFPSPSATHNWRNAAHHGPRQHLKYDPKSTPSVGSGGSYFSDINSIQ